MHIQTHIMSGWIAANLVPLTPKDRFLAMIAASAADLDGIGIFFDGDYYSRYHHVLGHNLLAGITLSLFLILIGSRRFRVFLFFLLLFHLHLILDYFGSGLGWGISYFWPFSTFELMDRNAWDFFSWQNLTAAWIAFLGCVAVAAICRRTPLEFVMPSVDRRIFKKSSEWLRLIRRP